MKNIRRSVGRPLLLCRLSRWCLHMSRLWTVGLWLWLWTVGVPASLLCICRLLDGLHAVLNAVVCDSRKYHHMSPLLCDVHWLRVPDHIKFEVSFGRSRLLCRNNTYPRSYLETSVDLRITTLKHHICENVLTFLPRCITCSAVKTRRILSVRPSVCPSHACIVTKR